MMAKGVVILVMTMMTMTMTTMVMMIMMMVMKVVMPLQLPDRMLLSVADIRQQTADSRY
jgi:hypothetical protein